MQSIIKIVLVACFIFPLYASEKSSIFVLHSYAQEYAWTKKQHQGFVSYLNKSEQKFEFYIEYLDTKRLKFTPEYQALFLNYLKKKYVSAHPEYIYVTDDDALNFIVNNYDTLFGTEKKIHVFFSGINNLDIHKTLPKESFTGVYEIKDIKENIDLIKQFSPQTRDIYLVGDNSHTYMLIEKEIRSKHTNFTNINFHYITDEYISKVISKLPDKPRSFIVLTTIGNLKDDDYNTLLPQESIEKIIENKNLIVLTMEDAYMHKGVVGGYMTSGIKQGEEAARLLLEYQKNSSAQTISSLLKSPNIYMFNSKELTNSRIILSEYIARDAVMIGKDDDFIEQNKSILLNILITTIIVLLFAAVSIYALQRGRYLKVLKKLEKLDFLRMKIYTRDRLIKNAFSLANMCYWRFDTKNDKLFVSQELLDVLAIDNNIYKDDSKLLDYFIHLNDKAMFHKMLSDVKTSVAPLTFTHNMVTSDNRVLNVTHTLYAEHIKKDSSIIIIGIIKVEKH